MPAPTQGTIEVAEKIAHLIGHSPAGGIFTHAVIPRVAGVEIEGFGGFATFKIDLGDREYEVAVQRAR